MPTFQFKGLTYSLVFLFLCLLSTSCEKDSDTESKIIDYDGNEYTSIQIGDQIWMVENLRVSHYRNGDSIPNITKDTDWENASSGAYGLNYDEFYYNFYAVNDIRGIAPKGWRIATYDDWKQLIDNLGGLKYAGEHMKSVNNGTWATSNYAGDNSSGFSANGYGYRGLNGGFGGTMFYGYWWTSTEYNTEEAFIRYMDFNSYNVKSAYGDKHQGFSVRCIKE